MKTTTPILEKRSATWIQLTNLVSPSFSQKEIELYRDGVAQPIITDNGLYHNFTDLVPGKYRAKQRRADLEWSDLSNEIDLTNASKEPTVESFEMVLSAQNRATYTGTGVAGATIKCINLSNNTTVFSVVVTAQGTWTLYVQVAGNYAFSQTEVGKAESLRTVGYTVNNPETPLPKANIPFVAGSFLVSVGTKIDGTAEGQGTIKIYRNSYSYGGEYASVQTEATGAWSWTPGTSDFGSFYLTFTKNGYQESDLTAEIVVQKAQLPKPSLDTTNILTTDVVTILNSGNYSSYVIKKGGNLAIEGVDIVIINLTGVDDKFKFLMPGKYIIIGQRAGYSDSEASSIIEVVAPQAKVYTISIRNLCGLTLQDIQVGIAPLAGDVQVWYDVLTAGIHTTGAYSGYPYVTVQLPEVIPTQNRFFIRDKNNTSNVSPGVYQTV